MKQMKLNSVIFHTNNLKQIRNFYTEILGLQIGTYTKDGKTLPDESDKYINFQMGNSLLCFEEEGNRIDLGTVVLNVQSIDQLKETIRKSGTKILKESSHFFMSVDPDGRELIFEPFLQSTQ